MKPFVKNVVIPTEHQYPPGNDEEPIIDQPKHNIMRK